MQESYYATLRVEERPGDVFLATLSRPEVANAFDTRRSEERRVGKECRL